MRILLTLSLLLLGVTTSYATSAVSISKPTTSAPAPATAPVATETTIAPPALATTAEIDKAPASVVKSVAQNKSKSTSLECHRLSDTQYEQKIVGLWEGDQIVPINGKKYFGTTKFEKDGTFTGLLVNKQDLKDKIDAAHGTWEIKDGLLIETFEMPLIAPGMHHTVDRLTCMGTKMIKAQNEDGTHYSEKRLA